MPPRSPTNQQVTILRKAAYFLLGLLLIPMCLAAGYSTLWQIVHSPGLRRDIVFFLIGCVSYLTFFLAFRKPLRPYLLGHELTHALWVWLFRGRVHQIRVSARRGQIKATKRNTLIALAPYFFPFYTFLLILAYWVASIWISFGHYHRVFVFAVGFTWSFHLLLSVFMLRGGQEDLRPSGSFFSLVVIFLFNLIVFGLIIACISDGMTIKGYLSKLTHDVVGFYTALARAIGLG